MVSKIMLLGAGQTGAGAGGDDDSGGSYDPPAVSSGLVVKLDVADPDSWDSGASTKWINTVDDEEGDFFNGPAFDDTDDIFSIQYDGSDDYFKLSRSNADLDAGFTISLWYYTESLPSTGWFFGFGDGTAAYTANDFNLAHNTSGNFKAWSYGSAMSLWSTNSSIDNQTWCFLTFVNQNDGTIDLFVDGVKDTGPPAVFHEDTAPNDDIYLASLGGGNYEHDCKIAQYLAYDRSLSDAEVEDLWDGDKERFGLS